MRNHRDGLLFILYKSCLKAGAKWLLADIFANALETITGMRTGL